MKKNDGSSLSLLIAVIPALLVLVVAFFLIREGMQNSKTFCPAYSSDLAEHRLCYADAVSFEPVYSLRSSSMYVSKPSELLVHCELTSGEKVWLEISLSDYQERFDPTADLVEEAFPFNAYAFAGEPVLYLEEPVRIYARVKETSELAMGEKPDDPYYLEYEP